MDQDFGMEEVQSGDSPGSPILGYGSQTLQTYGILSLRNVNGMAPRPILMSPVYRNPERVADLGAISEF